MPFGNDTSESGGQTHGNFNDMSNALKKKQVSVQLAEEQLKKLGTIVENKLTEVNNLKSKKYYLEHKLKSVDFRLKEFEKNEKECERDLVDSRESNDELKHRIHDEEELQKREEEFYDEKVYSLTEKICHGKNTFDRETIEAEIMDLEATNQAVIQELHSIQEELAAMRPSLQLSVPEVINSGIKQCRENRYLVITATKEIDAHIKTVEKETNTLAHMKLALQKELADLKSQLD